MSYFYLQVSRLRQPTAAQLVIAGVYTITAVITLGAHAQRVVRVSVLSIVCVRVSVYDYSRTTGNEAAYERFLQL